MAIVRILLLLAAANYLARKIEYPADWCFRMIWAFVVWIWLIVKPQPGGIVFHLWHKMKGQG